VHYVSRSWLIPLLHDYLDIHPYPDNIPQVYVGRSLVLSNA
jgi:hypothetical protein